jgi:tetratricopeptide (TPR) repeat protein
MPAVPIGPVTRYDRAIHWRIHDAYFAQRGVAAWLAGDIPQLSTSNFAVARQHASFVAALVRARGADATFTVLEVAGGSGRFAAHFMRALAEHEPDVAPAVRYVFSDYAPRTVREACTGPELSALVAAGRVVPAVFDTRGRPALRTLEGALLDEPVDLVLASYLCCVMPARMFRVVDGTWDELHVATTAHVTDGDPATVDELVAGWFADATVEGILGSLRTRNEWHAVAPPDSELDALHAQIRARHADGLARATFSYPQAFIEFLFASAAVLRPGGTIVVNDFGSAEHDPRRMTRMPKPRLYGNSLNYEVDFTLFDAVAAVSGLRMIRTHDRLRSIHTAVFAAAELPPATQEAFDAIHRRQRGGQDVLDFSATARLYLEQGDAGPAIRFLHRCIELDPYNPGFHHRLGEACIEAKLHDAARGHLRRGQALDPWLAHDFELLLGRAAAALGELDTAIAHYRISLSREPHPVTYANLASVHELRGDLPRALRCYQRALAFAPDDELITRVEALRDRWWQAMVAQVETDDGDEDANL